MDVAVAGGTGWIGRLVVEAVRDAGHDPSVISRSRGVDVTTGAGLDEALRGVRAVIDVTNITTTSRRKAVAFFEAGTARLLAAGHRAGVAHHVALSIVGCDRVGLGYYAGKRRQEELVLNGPVPASVLRATQFYEFAPQMIEHGFGPFVPGPRMRSQPVAAREVAEALVVLATGEPAGLAPDLAGPEVHDMAWMVRQVVRARGLHRVVIPLKMPGSAGRQMAGDGLLPREAGPRGKQTFREWLGSPDGSAVRPDDRAASRG
jgi:uncharacterized protein YbjT (DUF2867 family)